MTKIVCTSDWHGNLYSDLPVGDVLVIAGDSMPIWDHGRQFQANWFKGHMRPHLENLPFKDIILIGGNHDFVLEESKKVRNWMPENVHYLQDESIEIDGLVFHGSPWSPRVGKWAFMEKDHVLAEKWNMIPDGSHVWIIHGPPHGACDFTSPRYGSMNVGSRTQREAIVNKKPALVICGHIHEGYGKDLIGRTVVANVAHCNVDYNPVNPAMVFDINKYELDQG